ncbi:hypothetical protein [Halomarina ordinaria]|uniref:MBL fold metallo-hydrolase n=1 Tax=Halomarina ordinaria TaxID=3033939 RepID=A0ABD5U9P9_9EURY|nr:hypothetical protein [Halomarina sp. PSRA2]
MTVYDRTEAADYRIVDWWDDGVGWLAHPEEDGRRTSHAVRGDDGVWVFDPLDAPGVDDRLADLGTVAGVVVLSDYHVRDASALARRHKVAVHVPEGLDRAAARVDAPLERCSTTLGESGFRLLPYTPFRGWNERLAYREADGTLYAPDALGTAPPYTVGEERVGVSLFCRLRPPHVLAGLDPERLLVGHGTGVFEDAPGALSDALSGARERFPTALRENGWAQVRALVEALR